jgi:hypothetical protein
MSILEASYPDPEPDPVINLRIRNRIRSQTSGSGSHKKGPDPTGSALNIKTANSHKLEHLDPAINLFNCAAHIFPVQCWPQRQFCNPNVTQFLHLLYMT